MAETAEVSGAVSTQAMDTPDQAAERLVTPELKAKFDQVFEGAKPTKGAEKAPTKGKTKEAAAVETPPKKQPSISRKNQRADEEAESLASLEDADEQDRGGDEFEDDDEAPEADDAPAPKKKAEPAKPAGKAKAPEDGSDATPTLDPTLRQAAKRAGLTNDEIDNLWDKDPEVATKTFERFHASFSDLSARYSRITPANEPQRPHQPARQPAARQVTQPVHTASEAEDLLASIYGDNLNPYTEKYGKDFVDEIVRPLVDTLTRPIAEMHQHFQQSQQRALASEASQFFKGLEPALAELYGGSQATNEQLQARGQLAKLADQIRFGAMAQGEQLTVTEALELACMSHARDHLQAIERKKLVSQVRARSKAITARPTQRKNGRGSSSGEAADKGIEAAMDAYRGRAAEMGYDV